MRCLGVEQRITHTHTLDDDVVVRTPRSDFLDPLHTTSRQALQAFADFSSIQLSRTVHQQRQSPIRLRGQLGLGLFPV